MAPHVERSVGWGAFEARWLLFIQPQHPASMHSLASSKKTKSPLAALSSRRGYTMAEIIIVIVVLGLLTAIAIPIYNNVRNAGADNVKIKNADLLNQMMTTLHNGGVDMTSWTDASTVLTALNDGVTIPSVNPAAAAQQIKLEKPLNPAAYRFTPARDSTVAPSFDPILNQPSVAP